MNNTEIDVLDALTREMNGVAEIDPPTGMWERFAARLDAEPVEQATPAKAPAAKRVFLRGLALVPNS